MNEVPRHDHGAIKAIAKAYGLEVAKWYQAMPFFLLPAIDKSPFLKKIDKDDMLLIQKHRPDVKEEEGYIAREEYRFPLYDDDKINEILPFPAFCQVDNDLIYKQWRCIAYLGEGVWEVHRLINQEEAARTGLSILPIVKQMIRLSKEDDAPDGYMGMSHTAELMESDIASKKDSQIIKMWSAQIEGQAQSDDFSNEVMSLITGSLAYFQWADGMHLVKVRRPPSTADKKAKKKGDLKPWTRTDKPHYIYLDAPQTEAEHPANDDPDKPKRTVRPHHRRAHWYTLRDPKFRHHPFYMKPQRRKATWVGPKVWTVSGTIYTVIDDDHEGDDDDNV